MAETCIVVGAGVAAYGFANAIREAGYQGRVVLFGAESVAPYERPPLSKQFLTGKKDEDALLFQPVSFYEERSIELCLGTPVEEIDLQRRVVRTGDGSEHGFDQLVLATGARPNRLPVPGAELAGIFTLRSLADARALRAALAAAERVFVVGGGFIGCEVAASARLLGKQVALVETLPVLLGRVLGPEIGAAITRVHERQGVALYLGRRVVGIEGQERVERVVLDDGTALPCDLVVVGIGVQPALPAIVGELRIDDGVVVDATCAASVPGVWAAGDVARWWHPRVERFIRVEHYDNALEQGAAVAKAVAGQPEPYVPVPSFWSDQYDLTIQQYGYPVEWDEVVVRGDLDQPAFTAFYLKEGRIYGAVIVRRPREMRPARRLVEALAQVDRSLLADPNVDLRQLMS
ncbi:FAD-dependent oxidoreductase [Thermomicrobium sp. 4228-Ro]|uniref:NAD(P)/FAD-dependent oxidoreductase n=1 Tax=Thermomicrobium sp. 4228-Ro TaxID=2993937 RepID=UPI002248CBB1|nr:FAD-dependent oxidoreductase [Thermomicrobium sp. 4228-Ro]MCX2727855.1 FAD-dependent oxidoreductase [Thermomicrobium sp. 4228-Ro]